MTHIWIIGAGRFGRRAARLLSRRYCPARITMVDPDPDFSGETGCAFEKRDGVAFCAAFRPQQGDDWIIPALPLHLAYKWLHERLKHRFRFKHVTIDNEIINRLPNVIEGGRGRIYTSAADFFCPPDCPEPKTHCYHTGRHREYDLFDFIAEVGKNRFFTTVVRSHQKAPGVGGFQVKSLFRAEQEIIRHFTTKTQPALLATSCRCHAVIDTFSLQSPGGRHDSRSDSAPGKSAALLDNGAKDG